MLRVRAIAALLMLALVGGVASQDKDAKDKAKDGTDEKKFKGFLPMNFKKLGLTDKQVQAIYKIQGEHRPKIEELKRQIKKHQDQEKEEVEKVLTDEQRKRLDEIRTGKKDK